MSTIVVDASAVVDVVCGFAPGDAVREELRKATSVAAPAHLDAEVLTALGRLHRAGGLRHAAGGIAAVAELDAVRWPLRPLLGPAWLLTDRIAVRDALYVALAISLEATLVSTDLRLCRDASHLVRTAPGEVSPSPT